MSESVHAESGPVPRRCEYNRRVLSLARASSVPPYVIASDRTLRDLAAMQPRTMDALLAVHGIGPAKAERYGLGFLAVIARALGGA